MSENRERPELPGQGVGTDQDQTRFVRGAGDGKGVTIYWRPHHEWNPNLPPAPDFIAFDGEELIGRVFQIQYGQGEGRWLWTMTVGPSGLRLTFATSGVEDHRGDAGRRVVEAYERLRRKLA